MGKIGEDAMIEVRKVTLITHVNRLLFNMNSCTTLKICIFSSFESRGFPNKRVFDDWTRRPKIVSRLVSLKRAQSIRKCFDVSLTPHRQRGESVRLHLYKWSFNGPLFVRRRAWYICPILEPQLK